MPIPNYSSKAKQAGVAAYRSQGKPRLPLKYHGGKGPLAATIVGLMPPHTHYVEPFCGGCAVLLAHSGEGRSELINDLDHDLITFWRVLRDPVLFPVFQRRCTMTPLAREEWQAAADRLKRGPIMDPVEQAHAFFVFCRQSLAGRMKSFTPPTRSRLRDGMNGNVSEWLGSIEHLPETHERVRRVFVENMNALELIPREDTPETLYYFDPGYLIETRSCPDVYRYETSREEHVALLKLLPTLRGKWILSGYPSTLYDTFFRTVPHKRYEFDKANDAAGGKVKQRMTEVLWCSL